METNCILTNLLKVKLCRKPNSYLFCIKCDCFQLEHNYDHCISMLSKGKSETGNELQRSMLFLQFYALNKSFLKPDIQN